MARIKLYHGSENIIKTPQYHLGNPKNDYGYGFYCTENIELAKEWGCTEENDGFANEYDFNLEDLQILNLSDKNFNILNWLAILLENRNFELSTEVTEVAKNYILNNFYVPYKDYDVIRGYRADDSYFSFAKAFLNNSIPLHKLNEAMYLGKLGEQIVLKSQKAFSAIKFISSSIAESKIYFPKKIQRDSQARMAFDKIKSESKIFSEDAIFVMDIIRGGMKNGDARIPEILFR